MLVIILFSSCEKKVTDLEFEKNVMTEIFPSLIDSTCIDIRLYTNFPPEYGESIYDKTGHYIGVDSTKATKEQKQKLLEWKINTEKIKKDTSKIIIAFDPLLKDNSQDLKEDFAKHFKNAKIFTSKEKKETEYIFDFKNSIINSNSEIFLNFQKKGVQFGKLNTTLYFQEQFFFQEYSLIRIKNSEY